MWVSPSLITACVGHVCQQCQLLHAATGAVSACKPVAAVAALSCLIGTAAEAAVCIPAHRLIAHYETEYAAQPVRESLGAPSCFCQPPPRTWPAGACINVTKPQLASEAATSSPLCTSKHTCASCGTLVTVSSLFYTVSFALLLIATVGTAASSVYHFDCHLLASQCKLVDRYSSLVYWRASRFITQQI